MNPSREHIVEVPTAAGSLLLPQDDEVITPALRRDGVWEGPETRFLVSELRPGATFVDVGAHVGYFSLLASKLVGPSGSVIAIEPEERNLELLRLNLSRNDCPNVRVLPVAAHSAPGRMSLALDRRNSGGHRLVAHGQAPVTVCCVRLDDVLPVAVDLVKIDAQGYDHEIVEGMQHTFAANPDLTVLAELSLSELERRAIEPSAVVGRYAELGFTVSTFEHSGQLRRTSAAKLLAECGAGRFPSDFSLVLERPPPLAAEYPAAVAGLEVSETADGLIVRDPARNRAQKLNPTAAVVFELCTGDDPLTRIAELVREAFGLAATPTDEVRQCIDHLRSEGLVR